jgi:hypothetical protein
MSLITNFNQGIFDEFKNIPVLELPDTTLISFQKHAELKTLNALNVETLIRISDLVFRRVDIHDPNIVYVLCYWKHRVYLFVNGVWCVKQIYAQQLKRT